MAEENRINRSEKPDEPTWDGEADQERQLPRTHHLGGAHRRLFGVGEGPAEAAAGAGKERDDWGVLCLEV